jgi:citrate synthase
MTSARAWMTAAEAAGALHVSIPTLYAYVSRGFVRSQSTPGASRARGYSRDDVERLRRRTEARRDPENAATRALQWGVPILESSLTLIDGNTLYYRGHDSAALARSRSLEEVASLIWTGRFEAAFPAVHVRAPAPERSSLRGLSFVTRVQSTLAAASAHDPLAFDVRAAKVAQCGWRIIQLLAAAATGAGFDAPTIDQALARAWGVSGRGVDVLRAALILCADHELNVSSFTARCVASAGSNPYAVVIAGLAALEGTRHGGAGARVESMLASMRRMRDLPGAVEARLRRGEPIDGFGHPLYPHGDPRAAMLLEMLRERYAKSAELTFVMNFADAAAAAIRETPNVDFALAALARVLRLPVGSPLTLFAIARTIGWVGHAIEQYETGQLIRPRAKYVGVVPIAS